MGIQQIDAINVYEIFEQVQLSSACHPKYVMLLRQAVDLNNSDALMDVLRKCLQFAFSTEINEKNAFIERIIGFMATFAVAFKSNRNGYTDTNVIHPAQLYLFDLILNLSCSEIESHRYWSCKLFNKIFQHLEELNDDLFEKIKDVMLQRFKDPKAAIRNQAVITLHRLQDPDDEDDPIITQMCNVLESDYNAKVRRLCLEKLALNKQILPFILNRIRDVDAAVRLTAFQKLCPIAKYLRVSQKRLILQCGFNDVSEKVRKFVSTELLQKWLESYDDDYLKLMAAIRLDACEEDVKMTTYFVELMLTNLFKLASLPEIITHIQVNEQKVIEYPKLNWESALYYRIAVHFLRQCEGFEVGLNRVTPELVDLCRYIKGYTEYVKTQADLNELEYHFTLQQMFMITEGYDVSDVAGRQCLNSLIHHMLQNEALPVDVAESVLRNLTHTIPNVNQRSLFVCEIISNIIHGDDAIDYEQMRNAEMERKHAISQLQSEIITLSEQEKQHVFVEKNFEEAARVKQEIEAKEELLGVLKTEQRPVQNEKKTDSVTVLRSLNVAEALLRSPDIIKFNSAIATLSTEVINPALLNENDQVKVVALNCYALCCIIDKRSACYGIHLFSGLIFSDDWEDVRILLISLKTVVDLLTIYGLSLVEKRNDEDAISSRREDETKVFVGGTSLTDLIQALADHLDNEDSQVQDTATKGVCLLLLNSRITSSSLLSRIIIKWANPATDNERLKQFIGLTLNALTASSNCHLYFADAVLSTIRTLTYAPKGSALLDIDIQNILKFMANLCSMPSQGPDICWDLSYKILQQMREKPRIKINLLYSKMLLFLTIANNRSTEEFLEICDELKDSIRDTQVLKNVRKFITNISTNNIKLTDIVEE